MSLLVQQISPDEDEQRVVDLLARLQRFVVEGPYLQDGNNACWFCYQGIGDFGRDQSNAGHHERCPYLIAWQMQRTADEGVPHPDTR